MVKPKKYRPLSQKLIKIRIINQHKNTFANRDKTF